jgi:hypothetical protein
VSRARAWLLVVAGVWLTACSSGAKTIPLAQYVKKADAICAGADTKVNNLTEPNIPDNPTPADLTKLADFFDQTMAIARSTVQQLRALGTPDKLRDEARNWVANLSEGVTAVQHSGQEIRAGNLRVLQTLPTQLGRIERHANALAQRLGMKDCVNA